MRPGAGRLPALLVSVALLLGVVAVYHGAGGYGFVFDDVPFLPENPKVAHGLTPAAIRWALTATYTANWHPLTWFSHLLDVSLFGMRAGPFHLVNVALHGLNTVLLFLALRGLTGALWRSAFVAALFAVHPLHVESVAWVSERKDVLCALFWMLGLLAWRRYVASPGETFGAPRVRSYLLVVACFVLGFTAKAMIVTLPLALLLLDWWPLGRLGRGPGTAARAWRLLLEKLPLLALGAAGSVATFYAQRGQGAVASAEVYPLGLRFANAAQSCVVYLVKTVWPSRLAAFYPMQLTGRSIWPTAGALLFLAAVTAAALWLRRRRPWLLTGWLWHLVTLAPVIGIIQVGGQARADRYMYVPMVGVGLLAAWGAPALARGRAARLLLAPAAVLALAALAVAASVQAGHWRNQITFYRRMLAITPENWLAHNNYGVELEKGGDLAGAVEHYREAARLNPTSADARGNLAFALDRLGRFDEAIDAFRYSLVLRPDNGRAALRLGQLLGMRGRFSEALVPLREATRLIPWLPDAWDALGVTCRNLGLRDEAVAAFRRALRITPADAEALRGLASLGAAP